MTPDLKAAFTAYKLTLKTRRDAIPERRVNDRLRADASFEYVARSEEALAWAERSMRSAEEDSKS